MTIKRKRLSAGSAFVEVETSPQDTVDTTGFSATITGDNVGKTCQFTDTSLMQSNSGLLIGLMGFTVNADAGVGRVISTFSNDTWSNPDNAWNGNSPDPSAGHSASGTTVTRTVIYQFATSEPDRILAIGGSISMGDGCNGSVTVFTSTDDVTYTQRFTKFQGTGVGSWSYTSGSLTWEYVKVVAFLNNFDLGSGSVKIVNFSESATTSDTVTVRVISSSSQDATTGTTLIGDTVLSENTSTSIFSSDLVLSEIDGFINLVSVSNTGLPVPVDASAIISITEEPPP
jgi:hypothetical protein